MNTTANRADNVRRAPASVGSLNPSDPSKGLRHYMGGSIYDPL